ncbi:hypothetical protein [Bradyrhizobium oligotrophicum]|uniref:hypothetical protein n=1 Tax=Bradyrhizobium oligotrophicum TaxID=44255 RepID=UPI003EBDE92A
MTKMTISWTTIGLAIGVSLLTGTAMAASVKPVAPNMSAIKGAAQPPQSFTIGKTVKPAKPADAIVIN